MGHKLITFMGGVEAAEIEQRSAALTVYLRLLESDSQNPKDAQAFQDACKILGKTAVQAAADLATIHKARDLERLVREASGLDPARQAAQKAIMDSAEEKQQLLREWADRHAKKLLAASEIEQKYMGGQFAERQLQEMKYSKDHARLLRNVPFARLDRDDDGSAMKIDSQTKALPSPGALRIDGKPGGGTAA